MNVSGPAAAALFLAIVSGLSAAELSAVCRSLNAEDVLYLAASGEFSLDPLKGKTEQRFLIYTVFHSKQSLSVRLLHRD